MGKYKLLDCTLRDGAYIVNSVFGDVSIVDQSEQIRLCEGRRTRQKRRGNHIRHELYLVLHANYRHRDHCLHFVRHGLRNRIFGFCRLHRQRGARIRRSGFDGQLRWSVQLLEMVQHDTDVAGQTGDLSHFDCGRNDN